MIITFRIRMCDAYKFMFSLYTFRSRIRPCIFIFLIAPDNFTVRDRLQSTRFFFVLLRCTRVVHFIMAMKSGVLASTSIHSAATTTTKKKLTHAGM